MNFKSQCLVCLFQDEQRISNASKNRSDPRLLKSILAIEHNEFGQIYVVHALERSLHFSLLTRDFPELVSCPYPIQAEKNNQQRSSKINHLMIPKCTNYVSDDRKTIVFNANATKNHHQCGSLREQEALTKCRDFMIQMFEHGMSECFLYQEKSRSGLSPPSSSNAEDVVDGSCAISMVSVAESCSGKTIDSKSSRRRSWK